MEIELEGVVSPGVKEAVERGELPPHIICGVDVYMTPESAAEDGSVVNESRPCIYNRTMFFSSRHYRIIAARDGEDYRPCGTVEEIVLTAKKMGIRGAALLSQDVVEQDDGSAAYVLTPLDDIEMAVLMRKG